MDEWMDEPMDLWNGWLDRWYFIMIFFLFELVQMQEEYYCQGPPVHMHFVLLPRDWMDGAEFKVHLK